MANINENVESLLKSMDGYLNSKTVVGDPITVGENILLPLSEISFGVGAGDFGSSDKNSKGGGGMGGKITPAAILVVSPNGTKLVSVKSSDVVSKIMDMVPDVLNKFTDGNFSFGKKEKADEGDEGDEGTEI